MLKQQYPFDRAIGYKTGELRGAVSIKQPIEDARGRAARRARPVNQSAFP